MKEIIIIHTIKENGKRYKSVFEGTMDDNRKFIEKKIFAEIPSCEKPERSMITKLLSDIQEDIDDIAAA